MNKLLADQVKRHLGGLENVPYNLSSFIYAVNKAYEEKNIGDTFESGGELALAYHDLETLIQNVHEVLYSVNVVSNRLTFMSPACEQVYGYTATEFMTDDELWENVIYEEDKAIYKCQVERLQQGKRVQNRYRIVHKSGQIRWLENRVIPTLDASGRLVRLDGITNDITQRKEAEDELHLKNAEFKKLSSHLRHLREKERKHMAREVHDELGQLATALKIDIDWINIKTQDHDEPMRRRVEHANKTIEVLITTVRKIASKLRPSMLDDFGLDAALQHHCAEFQELSGINCVFHPGLNSNELATEVRTELFRIVQESMTNVMRHAKATQVEVATGEDTAHYFIQVADNGIGFDTSKKGNTFGLIGLRERAVGLNGQLTICTSPGAGTKIIARIPK